MISWKPGRTYDLRFALSADARTFVRFDCEVSIVTKSFLRATLVSDNISWPERNLSFFLAVGDVRKSWTLFHYRFKLMVVGVSNDEVTFCDVDDETNGTSTVLAVLQRTHGPGFIARNRELRPRSNVSELAGLVGTVWSVVALPGHGWRDNANLVGLTDPKFDEWRFLGVNVPPS